MCPFLGNINHHHFKLLFVSYCSFFPSYFISMEQMLVFVLLHIDLLIVRLIGIYFSQASTMLCRYDTVNDSKPSPLSVKYMFAV